MSSLDRWFEAVASGDFEFVKRNIKLVNEKNERGWTALHFAARFGQKDVCLFLKDNNADLTILNNEGKTAGQLAALWGNDEIVQLLTIKEPKEQQAKTTGSPFPENYETMFAGNPLNRFGWNRTKPDFLSKLARSPKSRYLVLNKLQALYNKEGNIQFVNYSDVASVIDRVFTDNSIQDPITDVIIVFLGIDETHGKGEDGEAYWALDLTPQGKHEKEYNQSIQGFESSEFKFSPTMPRAFTLDKTHSAIIAQAASMVDWNARHTFCPGCGKQTVLLEAGYKRSCPFEKSSKCISHTGIQNFSYPRTDAVVIACIIHPDGDKILLGRQKRFPRKMFSCLSGFVEAGETFEEAVRREALEEVGIIVDRVAYHSSQPWPFPNSLMIGFIAEAVSTDISFADDELEAAIWFNRSEVSAAIKGEKGASFFIPSKGTLASTLINAWLYDKKWQNAKL